MAMRVKHAERKPSLNDEIKMCHEYNLLVNADRKVNLHIDVYREIVNGSKYLLYISGSIYLDNTLIENFNTNYNWYYHGNDFRKIMKSEFAEIKNCLKRLNKQYNNVSLTITRTWEVIEY